MFARVAWFTRYKQSDLVVGYADFIGRVSRAHGRAFALGPRTSGTLLSDLYATAVAQLAGEGRIYHRGLYTRPLAPFYCELGWITHLPDAIDDLWNTVINPDGCLHRIPVCASEGARHVAKPPAAAAPVFSVAAAWIGDAFAAGCDVERYDSRIDVFALGAR